MSQAPSTVVAPGATEQSLGSRCLVVVCTYNERENLPRLVERIFAADEELSVLVVDDNSPDGTGRWAEEQRQHDSRLRCLHRPGKQGLGTATLAGLQFAAEQGFDYVVNLDADLSHDPRHIPELLAGMENPDGSPRVDVMIGSRYVTGGAIRGWPLKRHIMSRGVNFLSRWLLGLRARDCSGSYRCYRVALLTQLDWDDFLSRGYSVLEELLWRLKRQGGRFEEIPITFEDRLVGQSKISFGEVWRALVILLRLGLLNLFTRP